MNRPCRLQSVRRLDTRVLALLAVVADDRIAERTPEDRGQRAEDDGHDPERLLLFLQIIDALAIFRVSVADGAEEGVIEVLAFSVGVDAGVRDGDSITR